MTMKNVRLAIVGLMVALAATAQDGDGWKSLFDGKTLDGWEIHGGKATYKVDGDAIVGTSAPNSPNTFLCTTREYADFAFEYEYFPHDTLNCGVQFRSKIREKGDRVWGYQCEIDPSDRKWSAGIFEESARGWLYPVESEAAKAAYKPGEWNKVRIVCLGPWIRTWLNGVPVAEIVDQGNSEGIIGLQIHGVGGNKTPMSLKWRKLRIKELTANDAAELLDADTDTVGMLPARGADVLLTTGGDLSAWKLRPNKVPWMDKYVPGKLQWTYDAETGIAVPEPRAGSMDSVKAYGAHRIHVEFRTPPLKTGERPEVSGNSGLYLQGRYELQICNSAGLDPADNLCGGIYKRRVPDVNAAKAPGEWQTYDVWFTPARYEDGKKTTNARVSAKLNGEWIHRNVEIAGGTGSGDKENVDPGPLRLQEHQQLVEFRNVWIADLDNAPKLGEYDPRKKNQQR